MIIIIKIITIIASNNDNTSINNQNHLFEVKNYMQYISRYIKLC